MKNKYKRLTYIFLVLFVVCIIVKVLETQSSYIGHDALKRININLWLSLLTNVLMGIFLIVTAYRSIKYFTLKPYGLFIKLTVIIFTIMMLTGIGYSSLLQSPFLVNSDFNEDIKMLITTSKDIIINQTIEEKLSDIIVNRKAMIMIASPRNHTSMESIEYRYYLIGNLNSGEKIRFIISKDDYNRISNYIRYKEMLNKNDTLNIQYFKYSNIIKNFKNSEGIDIFKFYYNSDKQLTNLYEIYLNKNNVISVKKKLDNNINTLVLEITLDEKSYANFDFNDKVQITFPLKNPSVPKKGKYKIYLQSIIKDQWKRVSNIVEYEVK